MSEKIIVKILKLIIEKCCADETQELMQSSLELGIRIIKNNGKKYSAQIINVIDYYLDKKDMADSNQISAIVFIGICAPFLNDKNKVQSISKKILQMVELPSENLQKSLSSCLPELILFFDSPENLILKSLDKIKKEKDQDKQRGQAYLCTGNYY